MKVLTDDSEQDDSELLRRTPRRVRFGGEIVKLRTPDSDSIVTNDESDTATGSHSADEKKTKRKVRSLIPVPEKRRIVSEPNSPTRSAGKRKTKLFFRSTPNISRTTHVFGPKVTNISRIPRRSDGVFQSTVRITINETVFDVSKEPIKTTETTSTEKKEQSKSKMELPKEDKSNATASNHSEGQLAASSNHSGIEILHNLMRSPDTQKSNSDETPAKEDSMLITERYLPTADESLLSQSAPKPQNVRNVKTTDYINKIGSLEQTELKGTYNSFQVCTGDVEKEFRDRNASFIPVSDTSNTFPLNNSTNESFKESKGAMGLLQKDIVEDLHCKVS